MLNNFIDTLRLPFRKERAFVVSLYKILGFYPHKTEIYHVALTHKSQAYRNGKGHGVNNERLEFLGDAILEAVVSDIVYHRYGRKREGFLTNTRSKIVQRSSLNRLAAELHIDELVQCASQSTSHNSYLAGNAFEALMGAVYLDRGYDYCKWFVEQRIIGRLLNIDNVAQKEVNFKSKLLEWSQKNRMNLVYEAENGEAAEGNSPTFTSRVLIEGILVGDGTGYSKKESHQQAAKNALVKLRRDQKLLQQIYGEKEKRTAMEAPEMCAVPDVVENEDMNDATQATPQQGETQKPRRRAHGRSRRAPEKEREEKCDVKPAEKTKTKDGEDAEKKPVRSHRRKPSKVTAPDAEAKNKAREDIIAAAEQAAFEQ